MIKYLHKIKWHLFTAYLLAAWQTVLFAQTTADTTNFSIKGSKLYIESGTQLYIDGTINNTHNDFIFDATPDGQVNNSDTIFIAGDMAHQISGLDFFLTAGSVFFVTIILNIFAISLSISPNLS